MTSLIKTGADRQAQCQLEFGSKTAKRSIQTCGQADAIEIKEEMPMNSVPIHVGQPGVTRAGKNALIERQGKCSVS